MALQQVLRQEHKYLLNPAQADQYKCEFRKLLSEDAHNGKNGYLVRSLYFDTLNDRDLAEKLAGVEIRRKIRLRIYAPDANVAFLEMKQKEGENQDRKSVV